MTNISPAAPLQRYWNPKGGGVEPHDAGMLYLRDDVDAAIATLAAEREALRAKNERLREALEIAARRANQWANDEDLSDWAEPARIIAADIDAALKGGAE